jgi:hypothetical protein
MFTSDDCIVFGAFLLFSAVIAWGPRLVIWWIERNDHD